MTDAKTHPNTPVRIYVYWHPDFTNGEELARQIYHWFRLPTAAGIPVYFRSVRDPGEKAEIWQNYESSCDNDIVLVLVDDYMVASLPWRQYLEDLVNRSKSENGQRSRIHVRPIAIDATAYQMPTSLSELNFIRKTEGDLDNHILLTRVTEALCRILRQENLRQSSDQPLSEPIKVFLSHAKADRITIPQRIKKFIQTETQCDVFFDENDIAYGDQFKQVIEKSLNEDSAGLIVVQGDSYADRPWCRKEIRDFLRPVGSKGEDGYFSIMPSMVVTTFSGKQSARTIPELGHTPILHWTDGAERQVVVMMLREILFANFYHLLARRSGYLRREGEKHLFVNRPPDPIMIEHLFLAAKVKDSKVTLHHPGHGLTLVEKDGLNTLFPDITFHAYGEELVEQVKPQENEKSVDGKAVIAISAGNSQDSISAGLTDEHAVELLRRILQPLFRRGISLLYGGRLPEYKENSTPWKNSVNFSEVFLEMLLSERKKIGSTPGGDRSKRATPGRLFNLSAWPNSERFKIKQEAQLINTCTLIRRTQEDAGITANDIYGESDKADADSPDQATKERSEIKYSRNSAICLTSMRREACRQITAPTPDDPTFKFQPIAHILIGGKSTKYSGAVPGIWEEAYYALDAERPCFLIGALRGAAGALADWLVDPPNKRPVELTMEYQIRHSKAPEITRTAQKELVDNQHCDAGESILDGLWEIIQSLRHSGDLASLFNNGLLDQDNRKLLKETSFYEISRLISEGLESKFT